MMADTLALPDALREPMLPCMFDGPLLEMLNDQRARAAMTIDELAAKLEEATKRIHTLEVALGEAITDVAWWGEYADREVQVEYGLDQRIVDYLNVLEGKPLGVK